MNICQFEGVSTGLVLHVSFYFIVTRVGVSRIKLACVYLQVHALYRTTGASFEKAQQEFATGVMANKTVQTATANAAASAARGAFKEQI